MPRRWLRGLWAAMVLTLWASTARAAELKVRTTDGFVIVTTGPYKWYLSTKDFDVVHYAAVSDRQRLSPGRATIEALGNSIVFGPPVEVRNQGDWVEFRGWADAKSNLWYIARYQFFVGQPFARLVFTVTDRHDTSPAEEPSDRHWKNRVFSRWRLQIGVPPGTPASVTQYSSYSFGVPGAPWVEVVGMTGAAYQWLPRFPEDPKLFQLLHAAKDGANQVVWHPMFTGTAELTALLTPLSGGSAYLAAKAVTYEITDASGRTESKVISQTSNALKLGIFRLGPNSVVRIKATGAGGEQLAIAGPLRVAPTGGGPAFEIKLDARHDGTLSDGTVSLVVKDFWQHHPISLVRTDATIGWEAIKNPALYTGGMGLTLETMISLEASPAGARTALYAPPSRRLPEQVHAIDGSTAAGPVGARYDALLRVFAERLPEMLEHMDNFGWRNWGDYQIGVSYAKDGAITEDWANLQYDLPGGLLLAWLRTGDPELWRVAQASVRHLMDIDLVKFYPFMEKLNGLVYRKGEMPANRTHITAEPITDQGYAFRSLLLYYRLTGEEWAADLAKQNIDRLVYYAVTRPNFILNGGRPTAWMLRSALAGSENFPAERELYQTVTDAVVNKLLKYYTENKRLPGKQPVWQGQILEGLAEYHRRTGRADVADMIVGYTRYLVTDCTRTRRDGRYEFMYCHTPGGSECPVAQWTDEDNYPFLWLSAIAYAYKLTGDPIFKKWQDALFTYGETKMKEHTDLRSWTSALAYPHLFLELSGSGK